MKGRGAESDQSDLQMRKLNNAQNGHVSCCFGQHCGWSGLVWLGHCGSHRVALIIELVAIKHEINFRAAGYAMPQKQNEASGALKSMLHA